MSSRQPPGESFTMPRLTPDQLERISRDVNLFPRPRLVVTRQIPPAGSVVPRGTTVQVVLTDINALPIEVFQPDVPEAFKGTKIGEIEAALERNEPLRRAVDPKNPSSPADLVQAVNASGLAKSQVQAGDATKAITAFRNVFGKEQR